MEELFRLSISQSHWESAYYKNKATHYSNYDSQGERAKTYKNIYVYLRCLPVFTEVQLPEIQ